jgi:hypothetical protein
MMRGPAGNREHNQAEQQVVTAMARVSQRDVSDKLVWTGTTIAPPGDEHV